METNWEDLLPRCQVDKLVAGWLEEDLPSIDVGGLCVGNGEVTATLWQK